MINKLIIPSGSVYGELTVIREAKKYILPSGQTNRAMRCKCSCGKIKNIRLSHLVRGRIRSCGHIHGERHGMTGTKLYKSWRGMIERATNSKFIHANRYKERGIGICKEWRNSFTSFKKWALKNGWEEGLQLDRIDNDKGYGPDNCRFVTNYINCNNKESTIYVFYNGEKIAIRLLLDKKNLRHHYAAILSRIKRGWNAQKAIDTKIREGNYKRKTNLIAKAS